MNWMFIHRGRVESEGNLLQFTVRRINEREMKLQKWRRFPGKRTGQKSRERISLSLSLSCMACIHFKLDTLYVRTHVCSKHPFFRRFIALWVNGCLGEMNAMPGRDRRSELINFLSFYSISRTFLMFYNISRVFYLLPQPGSSSDESCSCSCSWYKVQKPEACFDLWLLSDYLNLLDYSKVSI